MAFLSDSTVGIMTPSNPSLYTGIWIVMCGSRPVILVGVLPE